MSVRFRDGRCIEAEAQTVGIRLKMVRQLFGLSQNDMAASLGIGLRSYNNYEVGMRDLPLRLAIDVIQRHDLEAEWFLFGDEGRTPRSEPSNKSASK